MITHFETPHLLCKMIVSMAFHSLQFIAQDNQQVRRNRLKVYVTTIQVAWTWSERLWRKHAAITRMSNQHKHYIYVIAVTNYLTLISLAAFFAWTWQKNSNGVIAQSSGLQAEPRSFSHFSRWVFSKADVVRIKRSPGHPLSSSRAITSCTIASLPRGAYKIF